MPKNTIFIKYGRTDKNPLSAHAKAIDTSHQQSGNINDLPHRQYILWQYAQPLLFVAVVLLHALALPVRLLIELSDAIEKNWNQTEPAFFQNSII